MRPHRLAILVAVLLLPLRAAVAQAAPPGIGKAQVLDGFAATVVSVMRAHEAGAADYVAGKGNVFLLVTVQVRRQGSHQSFVSDPADFSIQTSTGATVESEQFGMTNELQVHHVYTKTLTGVIGFEVPALDKKLILVWQPTFADGADLQATWLIGGAGKTVQYYQ